MTDSELTRGSGMALWHQIAEKLEREIIAGRYPAGERLPTETRLVEQFGVNRHTVRRAVAALAERGLVRIEQGRGTFVQESVLDYRVKKRTRFSENVADQNRAPLGRLREVREEPAAEAVAKALGLRRGTPVVVVERTGEADGRPISVSSHYFPKARLPDLPAVIRETGSISAALTQLGFADYTRKLTRVTARQARAADARLLQQAPNKPILMTEGINVDATGQPIEYSVARFASDRVQLIFDTGM